LIGLTRPPISQTVYLIFLYSSISTLKPENPKKRRSALFENRNSSPIVGVVATISPNLSL
jgi:hypothetical protein